MNNDPKLVEIIHRYVMSYFCEDCLRQKIDKRILFDGDSLRLCFDTLIEPEVLRKLAESCGITLPIHKVAGEL